MTEMREKIAGLILDREGYTAGSIAHGQSRSTNYWQRACDTADAVLALLSQSSPSGGGMMCPPSMPEASPRESGVSDLHPVAMWRPIETAPKDGTHILGYMPDDLFPSAVFWDAYDADTAAQAGADGYWAYSDSLVTDVSGFAEPTHWTPLLAPPSSEAQSENTAKMSEAKDVTKSISQEQEKGV